MSDIPKDGPPPAGLEEAGRDEVMASIRLGLTLDSSGRQPGRASGDPRLRESKLKLMAQRIYEQLRLSNFRIFRGPPARGHGAGQSGPRRES